MFTQFILVHGWQEIQITLYLICYINNKISKNSVWYDWRKSSIFKQEFTCNGWECPLQPYTKRPLLLTYAKSPFYSQTTKSLFQLKFTSYRTDFFYLLFILLDLIKLYLLKFFVMIVKTSFLSYHLCHIERKLYLYRYF